LRFASTSPPSGCAGDLHPQAVEHARHTGSAALRARGVGLRKVLRRIGRDRQTKTCRRQPPPHPPGEDRAVCRVGGGPRYRCQPNVETPRGEPRRGVSSERRSSQPPGGSEHRQTAPLNNLGHTPRLRSNTTRRVSRPFRSHLAVLSSVPRALPRAEESRPLGPSWHNLLRDNVTVTPGQRSEIPQPSPAGWVAAYTPIFAPQRGAIIVRPQCSASRSREYPARRARLFVLLKCRGLI
jgi:hypothetical protein